MTQIKFGNRLIGKDHEPFIIAEMSGNHNHSLDRALEIAAAAAKAGAHAVKLQTYTADTITMDMKSPDFFISDEKSLWKGEYLYQLYERAHTPWNWHKPIFDRCHELGVLAFSTPFDETAVDLLEELNVPGYKIASFENNHLPLIRKVARTGKPVIVSTGMATVSEIDEAVRTIRSCGNEQIVLLKCTSTYPAPASASNLATIPHMSELFGVQVGLSDHTLGIGVPVAAVALGATVIEKHFTLSREDGGVDSAFSSDPTELTQLVQQTRNAWEAVGQVRYGVTNAEKASVHHRRSIYVSQDLKAGDVLTEKNVRIIRPGFGLPPRDIEQVLGKKVNRDVARGTALTWALIG